MKIILFARTLGSTRLCKISQESSLLSNFGSLPKIRNARFGRCDPLGVKQSFCLLSLVNFMCAEGVLDVYTITKKTD